MTEFPKAYYQAAGDVHEIHSALNTSYGDYSTHFWTGEEDEAKESIDALRRLIARREAQIEKARLALAAYSEAVKTGGPRAYHEYVVESFRRQRAEAEVA
jgi:hypothetical protein